jgi:L-alanine-DL-glutamate epimerase-like enolase superfamily enzyme
MKIVDIQVIPFWVVHRSYGSYFHPYASSPSDSSYEGGPLTEKKVIQSVTKIITDEGAEGYYLGGFQPGGGSGGLLTVEQRAELRGVIKQYLVGRNPYDREKFWQWMWLARYPEILISTLDMALWDLQGRVFGVPIHKLLGGCREKIKAYASTFRNLGDPEAYGQHALECKERGYLAYKIHPSFYFFDPVTKRPDFTQPASIDYHIAICRAVREAVGDEMVLMYDGCGDYNYEEALKVGRALEKLNYYFYEHPLTEYNININKKLTDQLEIPVLAPEKVQGSIYNRAEWIMRGASDAVRLDMMCGGITGCHKMAAVCEACGVKLELHFSSWANLHILGATSEDVCEYYERGMLSPGIDYERPQPYWEEICDPMDSNGYVRVPQGPGMGYKINWDYINDNLVKE